MHLEIFLILNKTKIILIVNKSEQKNEYNNGTFKMMQMSFIASKLYQKKVETLVH